jgi:adenosine 3'-phospho 5'-phosphosulfate transporter B2
MPALTLNESLYWGAFYSGGIILTLVVYGLLQERIMSQPYGDPPSTFGDSVFLVFCNRVFALIFAACMAKGSGDTLANKAPLWKYLAISFSNVYASTCQYEALKYVSFPVQMLGKSFKMMPVMVWGIMVGGKAYGLKDWVIALLVTGGVTEFLLTGPIESEANSGDSLYGLGYLLAFLALDGFTSTFQERLFKEHATSKYNQMLYVNGFSTLVSCCTLVANGGLGRTFGFIGANPAFGRDAIVLSAAAVSGQWFIYSMVKEFGALAFAATMNVRQMVSIIVSYCRFGHYITIAQILGLTAVFAALFYKTYDALQVSSASEKAPLLDKDEPDEVKVKGKACKV